MPIAIGFCAKAIGIADITILFNAEVVIPILFLPAQPLGALSTGCFVNRCALSIAVTLRVGAADVMFLQCRRWRIILFC